MPWIIAPARLSRLLTLVLVVGCQDASTSPKRTVPEPPVRDTIRTGAAPAWFIVMSGDGQSALAGRPVPSPIRLRLTDATNRPSPGYPVRFELLEGG